MQTGNIQRGQKYVVISMVDSMALYWQFTVNRNRKRLQHLVVV